MKGIRMTLMALIALAMGAFVATAEAKDKVDVCKHGCDYRTIQDAVDDTGKKAVINVEPGTYREGVAHRGLQARRDHDPGHQEGRQEGRPPGQARQGPERPARPGRARDFQGVDGARVLNLTVKNYLANGIHFVGPDVGKDKGPCNGYLAKNVIASFNRAYGIFAFNCIGGRMTKSVGFGHGDSAFYVGATPPQANPKSTKLDHLEAYENVLGYSGTNSKYVEITDSDYYNNGVGIVPNTLDSEDFEPSADGVIENNNIFWNNFNYFLPNSRVKTVSSGLGEVEGIGTIQFPTGVGVVMLGSSGWIIRNNNIFGNFKWGAASLVGSVQRPATTRSALNNQFIDNQMGATAPTRTPSTSSPTAPAAATAGRATTARRSTTARRCLTCMLYPSCPAPPGTGGTGASFGDSEQFGELASYVTAEPAREPGVLVGQARSPGVREVQAAHGHARARRATEQAQGTRWMCRGRDRSWRSRSRAPAAEPRAAQKPKTPKITVGRRLLRADRGRP